MLVFSKLKSFFLLPKKEYLWWKENWQKSKEFRKQLLLIVFGFGLAGLSWGWACYDWATSHNEAFTNPFSIILGVLFWSLFGSLSLGFAFFKNNKKKFLFLLVFSLPAWLLAFLLPAIFVEWLGLFSGIILPIYLGISYLSEKIKFYGSLIDLKPSLVIGSLWLEFLFTGLLISLFFLFFFKTKTKKNLLYFLLFPSFCLSFSSLVAPFFVNLANFYLFHSLLLAYLITFLLISLSFSLSLFRAIKKQTKNEDL